MSTLGNPNVDYIFGDLTALPPDSVATRHMSEKVVYLPRPFFPNSHPQVLPLANESAETKQPAQVASGTGGAGNQTSHAPQSLSWASALVPSSLAEPEGVFVFASFNKHVKLSSALFDVWCTVLGRLPKAKLWFEQTPQCTPTGERHSQKLLQ